MDETTDDATTPTALPFPAPRESEPDWCDIAVRKLDINRLPSWMRVHASRLLGDIVVCRGAVTRKIHDPEA